MLRVGWLGGPQAVDPIRGQSLQERLIVHLTHDLLTGYRADDMGSRPELAESWTHSDDFLTWTFKIRSGATWQDGEPVTAQDVVFTYDWVMDNQISPYAALTTGITSVEATDDQTVVFTLSEPKSDMDALWIPILPQHIWDGVDPADDEALAAVDDVGDGPFRLLSFTPGKEVRLGANEHYWNGRPGVDEVDFIAYRDPAKMARDLEAGRLDAAAGLRPGDYRLLRRDDRLQALAPPGRSLVDLGFACAPSATDSSSALKDQAFRQALQWAVDRRTIVQKLYSGFALPGSTLVAPGLRRDPDYHLPPAADVRYGYDLKKATQLLHEAGYVKMAGRLVGPDSEPVRVRLYASDSPPEGEAIARVVVKSLRALGITVDYEALPATSLRSRFAVTLDGQPKPDGDLFISDWVQDTDPSFILSVLTSDQIGGWNDSGWTSDEYDALFAQQAAATDDAERKSLVDQMQQLAYDASPYAVIAYPETLEAERTDTWQGWVQAPSGEGSALIGADNVDTYLYVRARAGTEPAPAAVPWWLWPALVAAGLAGALLLWAVERGLAWYRRYRAAAQAARRPVVRRRRGSARPARTEEDAGA
ncbi:MAG TPA: ABC transporter substrate-binding protein [Thermoleophilia bacterium]|nr:ABC transporter substrate-binding protein [Thermoleophilia bacterium]